MKKFIRDNVVLVLGLTLPLLLIVLFLFVVILPKMLSEPLQYDMLFVSTHYQHKNKTDYVLSFSVKDERVVVKSKNIEDKQYASDLTERLFIYDAKLQVIREIMVDGSQLIEGVETAIAEVSSMVVDSSSVSPDGYVLDGSRYSNRGLINALFSFDNINRYRLVKGNARYKLPAIKPYHYYNQLIFLGWVVQTKD